MSEHVNTPHCECDKCENWTRDHQPEQQGDVIARMLDAGDLSHGEDSWRSYCAEDQAQFRKAMTAAARVLLDEALGPVTGEEARQLWCSDQHVISFANKVIAARRARILTESKPRIPEALRTVYEYLKQNQPETEAAAIRYIEHIEDHNGER
jgi:hypothetical protein